MIDLKEDERFLLPPPYKKKQPKYEMQPSFVIHNPGVSTTTKAVVIILFLFIVSLPLAWYIHCSRAILSDRESLMREFSKFAFPTLRQENSDYQSHPPVQEVKLWFSSVKQRVWKTWWPKPKDDDETYDYEGTYTQSANILLEEPLIDTLNANKVDKCSAIPDEWRFDCYPETDASEDKCKKRGCCWSAPRYPSEKSDNSIGTPFCFYPKDFPSYKVVNHTKTSGGFTFFMQRDEPSYYKNDIMTLKGEVTAPAENIIRVKLYDPHNTRYEVPIKYPGVTSLSKLDVTSLVDVIVEQPSTLKIVRKSTGEILFDTSSAAPLIYTDQFIQFSKVLPSKYIYGLGERRDSFLCDINWKRYTMFPSDQSPTDNSNLYGSHPFALGLQPEKNSAYGFWLLNSNAMDVILQPAPAVTFRVIGGILDVFHFAGPSPNDIISQYTQVIGRPILPPYWSLGFHLCRFNYGSANRTRVIWQRTRDAGIPFDVQWNDIDYMDNRRDFTYDKQKFAELPKLVEDIHAAGMHYVPIIDPALDITKTPGKYAPYDEGIKKGIFIKGYDGNPFEGKVWSPNGAVWPDFTNPDTPQYWTDQFRSYYDQVPFDGAWIDMNEPSNFYNGGKNGCPNSSYEDPPYVPGVQGGILRFKTICMTAKQYASIHYNVHSLYGFTETISTNTALKTIRNKRPFIISRSTFPGQGHYGGHWSGDNFAVWDDMKKSIPAILDFNMFGIPLVGADICGFNSNTTAKLCQRWMELGAFYPFSRNHNTDDTFDQDPVALGDDVVRASVNALLIRYMLLPYLYTLFYRANQFGETVARPLVFEFPSDKATYSIDYQFLWGSGLMVLPVLEEDVTTLNAYFPKGTWYLFSGFHPIVSDGDFVTINTPLDTINVAFHGGHILPFQATSNTTTESRKNNFGLIVALDSMGEAKGELYWDDGDSLDTIENEKYNLLNFVAGDNKVTSTVVKAGASSEKMNLGLVMVMGVSQAPKKVLVNNQPYPFQYMQAIEVLISYNMTIPMLKGDIEITWV